MPSAIARRPLILLIAALALGLVAPPAFAEVIARLDATDAVSAAIAWSEYGQPDPVDTVLLGRDDLFADSLASGGLQGKLDAPLLLTPTDELDDRVVTELERLAPTNVLILGGTAAISPAVEADLVGRGYTVERAQGRERIETAVAIAERFFETATAAVLVRAEASGDDPTQAFADALGAGDLASNTDQPVLYTTTGGLSPVTRDHLVVSAYETVTVVGGTAAISDDVVTELEALDIAVQRIGGAERTQTAVNLVTETYPEGPPEGLVALIVDGQGEDAWAAGFAAASVSDVSALLLTSGASVPASTTGLLVGTPLPTVCGPLLPAAACDAVEQAETVDQSDARFAVLQAAEGTASGSGGARFARSEDGTALCYTAFSNEASDVGSRATLVRGDTVVADLGRFGGAPYPGIGDCRFGFDSAVIADLFTTPRDFAVRVVGGGADLDGSVFDFDTELLARLTPEEVVPGPGDPDGFGVVRVFAPTDEPDVLCYDVASVWTTEQDGERPVALHLHYGLPGDAALAPILLEQPNEDGGVTACTDLGGDAAAVTGDPGSFHADLHTAAYPDGAVRGQLADVNAVEAPAAKIR